MAKKNTSTPRTPGDSTETLVTAPEGESTEAGSTDVADEPQAAPKAKAAPKSPNELPDQADVDTDGIPYGKTVMSKQGHVCSTAPDPKRK